ARSSPDHDLRRDYDPQVTFSFPPHSRPAHMEEFFTAQSLIALATLAILEIVLGIDNVVFLAILSGKLPPEQQGKARTLGLLLAAGGRIALLFAITWVITLDNYHVFQLPFELPGCRQSGE